MTKVIGKREVLRVLNEVVKDEGEDRQAICYYTKGVGSWDGDKFHDHATGGYLSEESALVPECIVGQVVARLGGDMVRLSYSTDTWEAIVNNGDVPSIFKNAGVHLTAGANSILAAAQHVQDGRATYAEDYGIPYPYTSDTSWGQALAGVRAAYKGLNKVFKRSF
jgi:hypothetical protein